MIKSGYLTCCRFVISHSRLGETYYSLILMLQQDMSPCHLCHRFGTHVQVVTTSIKYMLQRLECFLMLVLTQLARTSNRPPHAGIGRHNLLKRVEIPITSVDIFGIKGFFLDVIGHIAPQQAVNLIIILEQFSAQGTTIHRLKDIMRLTQDTCRDQREGDGLLRLGNILRMMQAIG